MKKRVFSLILALLMTSLLFTGCGQTEKPAETAAVTEGVTEEPVAATREFTDDCGRTVTIPAEISSIAVSGPLAQLYIFPLCPELFAGVSNAFAEDVQKYISDEFLALPELGQLYGGKGTMDLEALLAAAPDVVIDVGDAKDGMAEDLNALTEQTGIPFVHIDATVKTAPEAYRRLGELTGKTGQAETLAQWCESTYADITAMMERVDADDARRSVLYCLGEKGLNVLAKGSFHAESVNLLGDNLAELADVVSSGAGNEVDMEQIILWSPEVILFEKGSAYETAGTDSTWQQLSAIANGEYYEAPYGPYGWLASPPSVQRYLGMLWLGELLYPDYAEYDLRDKVTEYYSIFYSYTLSDADFNELTANSLR